MNSLKITGGYPLKGAVRISGSKNGALALMSAALLVKGEVILHNVPQIQDVFTMLAILKGLGVRWRWEGPTLILDTQGLNKAEPAPELVGKMRASFYIWGPLLARFGRAIMPMPGGCDIGNRPVNFHLDGLQAMGATILAHSDHYEGVVDRLQGAKIYLDMPSAGATQHLMTTAVFAEGWTVIENAAIEPEVVNLADFLNAAGARIEGAGTSIIFIEGTPGKLHTHLEYSVIPDRIEAGTFALAGAITYGEIVLQRVIPDHLQALLVKMRAAGVEIRESETEVYLRSQQRPSAVDIHTMPYPGFPTDLQQPMCAFLTLATGTSVVRETIYEKRVQHVPELQRMGADILVEGRTIIIRGVDKLHGAAVQAHDLRGGAALVIAALGAEGTSEIHHMEHVDRGYEQLESKLQLLGAQVVRTTSSAATEGSTPDHVSPGTGIRN